MPLKPDEIVSIVSDNLDNCSDRIKSNIQKAGLNASGKTANSLHVKENDSGATLYGRKYFRSLENGRSPGKVPYNMTEIIKQWIKDKGIRVTVVPYKRQPSLNWKPKYTAYERSVNSFAYLISKNIKENGTALYRSGGRDDIYTNEINKTLVKTKKDIGSYFKLESERL